MHLPQTGLSTQNNAIRHGKNIFFDLKPSGERRITSFFSTNDFLNFFRIFLFELPVSWVISPTHWANLTRALASGSIRRHRHRTAHNIEFLNQIVASSTFLPSAETLELDSVKGRKWERLAYFRSLRPGGWAPKIRVHGSENLAPFLAAGTGFILWGSPFIANNLIAKIAYHRLGLDVYHFSRPVHGLSSSRLGIRLLNPLFTSVELKFLKARVIAENRTADALSFLGNIIRNGGVASITVGNRGRKTITTSLLGQSITIASGPIFLSRKWGSFLVPTFALKNSDNSFDVWIGTALTSKETDSSKYCLDIAAQYADQLEPFFLSQPGQWQLWDMLVGKNAHRKANSYRKV